MMARVVHFQEGRALTPRLGEYQRPPACRCVELAAAVRLPFASAYPSVPSRALLAFATTLPSLGRVHLFVIADVRGSTILSTLLSASVQDSCTDLGRADSAAQGRLTALSGRLILVTSDVSEH